MTIWAIADIHGSATDPDSGRPSKPMDVFGDRWSNHVQRLESAWRESVKDSDTVLLAGDIDWGLRLEDAHETLERIHGFPGHKILIRGNHDYWWSSKTTSKVRRALPSSIALIHNDVLPVEGFNICGAKGSPVPGGIDWTAEDEKLLNRERERLLRSLMNRDEALPTIVMLHYPPFYTGLPDSPYAILLEEHGVSVCVYGHLHGDAAVLGPQGRYGHIDYVLVSGDRVDFRPVRIAQDGHSVLSADTQTQQRSATEQPVTRRQHSNESRRLARGIVSKKSEDVGDDG